MDYENNSDSDYEYVVEDYQTDLEDEEFEEIVPFRDDARFVLRGHTKGILSVICDGKNRLIFTGGMDDKIFVWNMENGQQMCELDGHLDSVTHLSIDSTDTFLTSSDLQGLVIIWKISREPFNIIKFKCVELFEIIDITWYFSSVTNEEFLYICDITGTVQSFTHESISEENSYDLNSLFYSQGKGCCCNGFNVILGGKYVAVLYGGTCHSHENCDNTNELVLCNVNTYSLVKVNLKSVANEGEDNDEGLGAGFATRKMNNSEMISIGDWSQLILVNVVETGSNVTWKFNKVPIKDAGLVTNVAFSDNLPYIAFASKNGVIGVYDVSHNRIRYVWNYEAVIANDFNKIDEQEQTTVSQLKWNPGTSSFFTAGLDGRLCSWDSKLPNNGDVPTLWGHSNIVWDLYVTRNSNSLITVSEDRTGRVFYI